MNENEIEKQESNEPVSTVEKTSPSKKKSLTKMYILAGLIVIVTVLIAIYLLEKEGRSSTNIFASILASQEASKMVAMVNGEKIVSSDLDVSISQFSQMASAQGVDISSPEAQKDIRSQALEVLVNTELLKQKAAERGISISDDQVETRLEGIRTELGGQEVLQQRMDELGISTDKLFTDVKDELLIQALLDQIFAEAKIEVSEEEIAGVYENAGGANAGLPAIEEVKEEIRKQITTSKEQTAIDNYLTEIKSGAQIEIVE